MSHKQTKALEMHAKGWGLRDICAATGLKRSEVQRLLGRVPRPKALPPREMAIRELTAEGHSAELIRANFGE